MDSTGDMQNMHRHSPTLAIARQVQVLPIDKGRQGPRSSHRNEDGMMLLIAVVMVALFARFMGTFWIHSSFIHKVKSVEVRILPFQVPAWNMGSQAEFKPWGGPGSDAMG